MNKKIRFLSALLALALCLTCMALPAFAEGEEKKCTCSCACYPGFVNEDCPKCSGSGNVVADCQKTPSSSCICKYHCYTYKDVELDVMQGYTRCQYCYAYYQGNEARVTAACQGQGRRSETSSSAGSAVSSGKSAPDVSGRYRTTAARLREKLDPVTIAQQQLYIDEVTNTIFNLYDADGNLITATLSSDGHFYIVPDSSGEYVYVPTGR